MEISSKSDGDLVQLQVAGSLDALTSPQIERAVATAFEGGGKRIVFDMRDVNYVSSAGLRAILLAARQAKAASGGIALFGLQPGVAEVFAVSGFGKIVPIAGSESEAREQIGGARSQS